MPSSKKIILIFIVLIEISLGTILVVNYYRKQLDQKKDLDINSITLINKEDTTSSQDKDLKYYWEFTPNKTQYIQPEWLSKQVTYHINSDGLNDLSDYQVQKPKKTYRIVALGDSFTFGDYVDTQHNWTEQLENLLNNSPSTCDYDQFEVINLGMPGFDVQYIAKKYQNTGAKYNPDLVIWFESDSGIHRFNELMSLSIKSCEENDLSINEDKKKESVYYCSRKAEEETKKRYSAEYLSKIISDSFEIFFNIADQEKTIFFYYNKMYPEKKEFIEKIKKIYEKASYTASIPNLSLSEKLADGHPNAEGHDMMSRSIFEYLKKNRLDCFN